MYSQGFSVAVFFDIVAFVPANIFKNCYARFSNMITYQNTVRTTRKKRENRTINSQIML